MRDLWRYTTVILPEDLIVLQDHHSAVIRVVGLVAGTAGAPEIKHQLSVIVNPQPFSLSSYKETLTSLRTLGQSRSLYEL